MGCEFFTADDGKVRGFICGRRQSKACEFCRKRGRKRAKTSTALCDWKVGKTATGKIKTCDAKLCGDCSSSPAPGKDLCPPHAAQWEEMRPAWEARQRERETTNA